MPPCKTCPACGKRAAHIPLFVAPYRCVRRCAECGRTYGFDLPRLSKRVVYLDQWALSDMMKALNPAAAAHKATQRWGDAFRKLHRLALLQLIDCPGSEFHRAETLVYRFRAELERVSKLLCGGVEFRGVQTIRDGQLFEHAQVWASGTSADGAALDLDPRHVMDGDIRAWQDRILLTCNLRVTQEDIDALRQSRQETEPAMRTLFDQWRSEKQPFCHCFRQAVSAYGEAVLRSWVESVKQPAGTAPGHPSAAAAVSFPPPGALTILAIRDGLRCAGIQVCDLWPKIIEYLRSDRLAEVPFVRVSALLYAAEAGKIARGKNEPPNRGFATDVRMISTLLPYCDAMLVDSACANYVRETGANKPYGTMIFSRRSREEFMSYLDEIEGNAPEEHLKLVAEVYGPKWGDPYDTLFASEAGPGAEGPGANNPQS